MLMEGCKEGERVKRRSCGENRWAGVRLREKLLLAEGPTESQQHRKTFSPGPRLCISTTLSLSILSSRILTSKNCYALGSSEEQNIDT